MQGIFFIVGTGRSGTNLIKAMLDCHPKLKAVTETHFISTLVRLYGKDVVSFNKFLM
ncbi:MAG: sulfotransferase [Calditrichaeota bacterium]|nr:sulfotransferase [Calditrichota bacterium]